MLNCVWLLCFLAFYGNLESRTSFDREAGAAGWVNASTIGNRTDYVKLTNEKGVEAYMICDFTHWEKLAKTSKRDHCNYASNTYRDLAFRIDRLLIKN